VFGLTVSGTRYTGDGKGWLLAELEPGRYRAVGEAPVPGRAGYPATEILAWDEADAVTSPPITSPTYTAVDGNGQRGAVPGPFRRPGTGLGFRPCRACPFTERMELPSTLDSAG
jgi:hypothetical protein